MNRKLDELGRIVIPMEIRKELDLKPDDKMEIVQDGEKIIIAKYKDTYCPECLTKCEHTDNFCRNCGLDFRKLNLKRSKKMKCKYLKIRTKNYSKYIYCSNPNFKKEITFKECKNCKYKEYKPIKELKKKSKNLKKLEDKRYSILTDNLTICYICNKRRKDDMHELFSGANRRKSMEWGLVIPICRICHEEWKTDREMRKRFQDEGKNKFYKLYSKEKFLEEFGKNYI